ncbi:MAG: hypothetical protein ACOX19_02575 [Fermentimonas sp.]
MQERLLDIGRMAKGERRSDLRNPSVAQRRTSPRTGRSPLPQKDGNLYVILKEWMDEPVMLTHVKHAGNVELLGYEGENRVHLEEWTTNDRHPPDTGTSSALRPRVGCSR